MTTLFLPPFVGLIGDLLGVVGRLLERLTEPDQLKESAEQLTTIERDVTAQVVSVRRKVEEILDKGVAGHEFVAIFGKFAADNKATIPKLEAERKRLLANPLLVGLPFPNFENLLREMHELDDLLTPILTATTARPTPEMLARARLAAAENGPGIPFEFDPALPLDKVDRAIAELDSGKVKPHAQVFAALRKT